MVKERNKAEIKPEKAVDRLVITEEEKAPVIVPIEAKKGIKTIESVVPKENPDESMELYNLIRMGYSEIELRSMYKGWKAKKFKFLYGRAKELISKAITDTETARADAIDKYNLLYQKAMRISNIKEAKNILDSLCKVQGLSKDVNISDTNFIAMFQK